MTRKLARRAKRLPHDERVQAGKLLGEHVAVSHMERIAEIHEAAARAASVKRDDCLLGPEPDAGRVPVHELNATTLERRPNRIECSSMRDRVALLQSENRGLRDTRRVSKLLLIHSQQAASSDDVPPVDFYR